MLLICEDHSSGAEEAFAALNDKRKRHDRHKIILDDEKSAARISSTLKRTKIKPRKNGSSSFPKPPFMNLLSHFSMNAEKYTPQEKNCNNDDELYQNDSTTEVTKKKPKIISSEVIRRKVIVKDKSPYSKKTVSYRY